MKNCIFFSLLFLICACSATISQNDASIKFAFNQHNFGFLPFEKESEFSFEFSNPGETPLVIYDVRTSCGCTVADWTKKPVTKLEERNGCFYLDDTKTIQYTFHHDYFFMMGDNRDNSTDFGYWGFVPEEKYCWESKSNFIFI